MAAVVRILVVQESDWIERGPHQSHHLLERLQTRGHEVRIIDFEIGWRNRRDRVLLSPRRELTARGKVVRDSVIGVMRPALVRLPILDYLSSLATHSREIRKQFREFRPNVVLGFGLLNAFAGIRSSRRGRVPFVYYLIDELHRLVPEAALKGVGRIVEQSNVRRASLVLSINQALREYAIRMGALPEDVLVLPAGVDLSRYSNATDGLGIRAQLGLGPEDLVLFFMGWVYSFSGLREVAEGIAAGDGVDSHVRLLVVGKGDSWDEIAQMVRERRAEDKIKMVGFRPYAEMPSYLSAANICLLPALKVEVMQNIVPIKIYEYLAAGKPVIATKLPGIVKEFGNGHGVVYVDHPCEVVPKAVELAKTGAVDQLGREAVKIVSGNDWEAITDAFESTLVELVSRAGRMDPRLPGV